VISLVHRVFLFLKATVTACLSLVCFVKSPCLQFCTLCILCRLQLNHDKSEVLWCSSSRRQHQIPGRAVRIGSAAVQPVSAVRDLGIMLDADVTMSTHIIAVVKASYSALRRIRSVRRSIPRRALLTLIQALVVSMVDCCNSVLAGVSDTLLRRLQSVLNAAAWLVFSARRSEHITPLLCELHWLRVPEMIKFRLCVLAF